MRDPRLLVQRLVEAMPRIKEHGDRVREETRRYGAGLTSVLELDRNEIDARITALGADHVGARPTDEYIPRTIIRPHPEPPRSIQDASAWAAQVLRDRRAAYVDGSQVHTSGEYNIPWGAANIHGSVYHPGAKAHHHDDATVFTPSDFEPYEDIHVYNPNLVIDYKRWEMELDFLIRAMRDHPGIYAIFDGSLVNSFATNYGALAKHYNQKITQALRVSTDTQSPLIGYTDTSRARDLVELVHALHPDLPASYLPDTALLAPLLHDQVGARTVRWECDRTDGILEHYDGQRVHFHYASLNPLAPCRIEYPAWLDPATVDAVTDHLFAQCLAFNGYPRSIDECHVGSSVTNDESNALRTTFQVLCNREGVAIRMSNKHASKRRKGVWIR